jgi:hypothetical protein
MVDGKPALQFEADLKGDDLKYARPLLKDGARPPVAVVEGIERNGQFSLKFAIALAKRGTPSAARCFGYLYVFSSGALYDNADTSTCKRNDLSRAKATMLPLRPSRRSWLRINVAGENYALDAILENPGSAGQIHAEDWDLPILKFLYLSVTNFTEAERQFRRLTALATRPEPKPAKLTIATSPTGATVYLDNEPKGASSQDEGKLLITGLSPGSYHIRVSSTGFRDWGKTVAVVAGDDLLVQATMDRIGPPPFAATEIIELLKGGVSPKRVAVLVQQRGVNFALDDDFDRKIRDAGGNAELLVAIAKAKK